MAGPGEIDISSTDDEGHEIRGSYRVAARVIHVTLLTAPVLKLSWEPMTWLRRWLRCFCKSST